MQLSCEATGRVRDTNSPFKQLPSNTIRLLRLLRDTQDSRLHGELLEVPLSSLPKYTAVSYTWGKDHVERYCDAIMLLQKPNLPLSTSLNIMLHSHAKRAGRALPLLWIDQICIDQGDQDEKEHQIGLMSVIYSAAEEVLVWLAEDDHFGDALRPNCFESIPRAFWAAECLQKCKSRPTMASLQTFLDQQARKGTFQGPGCPDPEASGSRLLWAEHGLSSLLLLWRHPWFERLWVRQEVALAKKVTFCYGDYQIASEKLVKACDIQLKAAKSMLSDRIQPEWTDSSRATAKWFHQLGRAKELFDLVKATTIQETFLRPDLLDCVHYTFDLKASKDHDLVYAVYHLSSATLNRNFWPDYSKSLGQLWRELAAYILSDHTAWNAYRKSYQGIEPVNRRACPAVVLALSSTQDTPKAPDSASWVPDLEKLGFRSGRKLDHYHFYSGRFTAGGPEGFHPIIDQNGRQALRLEGVILSRVDSMLEGTQQPLVGGLEPREFESKDYWDFIVEELVPWYLKCYQYKPYSNDFGTLLSQGIVLFNKPTEKKLKKTGPNFTTFIGKTSSLIPPDWKDAEAMQLFSDLLPFISRDAWEMDNRDNKRILAQLHDGRVGWVPETVKGDDCVILVGGAPFPFVVRDNISGLHDIIGDAYIDGIMKGEGWAENQHLIRIFEFS